MRNYLLHRVARRRFHRFMRHELGDRYVEIDAGPAGPREIILRTAVARETDIAERENPDYYFFSAYAHLLHWLPVLERHGVPLCTLRGVMEIGCGSARLIRHLRCVRDARLLASDVDADSIGWCRRHVPGVEFFVNRLTPPLPFANPDSLDLVLAPSVFTHIPLDLQASWIRELHRVLRPGGLLLADVAGPAFAADILSAAERERLESGGAIEVSADHPSATVSTQLAGSVDVYQTRNQVEKAFGAIFDQRELLPGPLDLLVLRK